MGYELGPDARLIEATRRGDPTAVSALYERHLPSVWQYACWRLHDDIDAAQDVVSETFLEAVRAIRAPDARLPRDGALAAWLRGIARNKIADCFRRRQSSRRILARCVWNEADVSLKNPDPGTNLERSETRAQVVEVVNRLAEEERLVLELKYVECLSVREIATRMDKTEKAVESLLFRSRRLSATCLRSCPGVRALN